MVELYRNTKIFHSRGSGARSDFWPPAKSEGLAPGVRPNSVTYVLLRNHEGPTPVPCGPGVPRERPKV
jgi:hypothetical protein